MRHLKAGLVGLLVSAAVAGAALADGIKGAPPPFDKGGVKIALVSYLSQGDYFEAYEAGVARQAKALGVDLHIFQGKQDAALQREQLEQAIALGVQGIIVSHGQPEAVKDVIQKAVDAGIKVVVKDIDIGNPNVPLVSQSDQDIASQVLDEALKENGDKFNAGYVFVAGFRPLELRGEVWADVKKAHPGIQEKAAWGAVDSNTATTVASQTAAALRSHPDITVVFAPYDEFARGVKLGAAEAGVADKGLFGRCVDRGYPGNSRTRQFVGGDIGHQSGRCGRGLAAGACAADRRTEPGKGCRGEARSYHARRAGEERYQDGSGPGQEAAGLRRQRSRDDIMADGSG